MRTTLNLNNDLYQKAAQITGISEKTKLIHTGLRALLREAAAKRLAKLYGAIKKAKAPKRRTCS